ncbi:MAG: asparagine synthase (glutamine-hydrolysing) [Candidatus Berkelbacteria bacterium Licking1014_85]|uniref:asparagine synthase (glutamine-hydrolyzing) n=1 Tax=Candidatus Berkelbacteria bacterium Licking1014_85 TaxID=2017148 RepID=A0A554LHM6_9BACT|nr:MAG: asparagine synthase (glutamine-hydrolysing) [Candidatus Berkelbacteria bacterium Licking1014_85]
MCGIAGIYNLNKKEIGENELKPLIDALKHRGPDGRGFFIKDNLGLAHCRLAIVGIGENGNQPLSNEDNSIWLVCNGEVYNFKKLREQLQKRNHRFKTLSDNEVILHLYEEEGLGFIEKISGMFAFAIWDKRKQMLILGRDRLGIKPLYYCHKNDKLIFASEIKGILAHADFKKELNYEFFKFYFFHNSIPAPHTPFKHIVSLPPAHLAVYNRKGLVKEIRYWQPEFRTDDTITERQALDEFSSRLRESVRNCLPEEVDAGIAMSGGIDSNVLLALAAESAKKPVKTFSCSFVDDIEDKRSEISVVEKLVKYFKADYLPLSLSPKELPEKIDKIVGSLDMPVCSFAIDYYLTEKIKGKAKIILTGDGTEELFGKYWNHRLAQSMAHILEYCQPEKERKMMENQLLRKYCEILPQRAFQFSAIYNFLESDKDDLFRKNIADLFGKQERVDEFIYKNYFNDKTKDFLNKILEADLQHFLFDHSLNVIDKLSMSNSIEIRVPYLEYKLVEYLAKIPVRFKMKAGATKYLLRRFAEQVLPGGMAFSSRTGVTGPPLRRWLTFHLEDYVKDVLAPRRVKKNGFLNPVFVKNIINEHYHLKKYPQYFKSDNIDTLSSDHTIKLWKLILFQIWWEKYSP